MSASQKKTELTKPRLSLFQGILPLDRSRVLADIMAGITLAAVGIPEVMGYTEIQSTKGHPCKNQKTSRRSWFKPLPTALVSRLIPSQPLGRLVKEWQCYTRLDLSPRLFMEENKPANNQWRPVQIQTILVPTDLRLESMVAFRYALTLAKLFDANLTLLHVFEESYSSDKEIGLGAIELLGVKKSNAERELAIVEEHLRAQHPKCRSCFRVGTPFEQIVREAEDIRANLIVMSCHSYSWLDRILHGSDAEGVLRRAPCPVLIAKEPK